uniref:FAD-binding oxidoreductase n=1 Tax=candidate division WWE3 bacterium TaxID=2053526 RepID=A0A831Z365_UNCKA
MSNKTYDVAVIGGGFFGCEIALHFHERGYKTVIFEKESDLFKRASFINQARVHNGYHYPRSLLTALRSRVNYPAFVRDYREAIYDSFKQYYAVANQPSKVTAVQYRRFCERIGAPLSEAPADIRKLFNSDLIEEVFETEECAFDGNKLRDLTKKKLKKSKIEVRLGTEVELIKSAGKEGILVRFKTGGQEGTLEANSVLNCTYSQINVLNARSGLPTIPLKHELTETVLVKVPRQIEDIGITVMCGSFFSTMPFPARSCHSLTHVRYTPHETWYDKPGKQPKNAHAYLDGSNPRTSFSYMVSDAKRYLSVVSDFKYIESLWEVKTVLPQSEHSDSRPILFVTDHGIKGYICIMGGKIDNIYDALDELDVYYDSKKKNGKKKAH